MTQHSQQQKRIVVFGATPKPDRYAFIAMSRLQDRGFVTIPVNPAFSEILGERCYARVGEVPGPIDTITMYVGPSRSTPLSDEIIRAQPRRIVFNPGAENPQLAAEARTSGIEVVEGCTLVMLSAGTF